MKEVVHIESSVAVLLVGGRSSRMGKDKFNLDFNGAPHWLFLRQELSAFFNQVCISCRAEQAEHFSGEDLIIDQHDDIGPMGAIHSAFSQLKTEAIFFLACDLPHFKVDIAKSLYAQLHCQQNVIAAQDASKAHPEPLVAIWKRSAVPQIEAYISQGNYSLMKCMSALMVKTISIDDSALLKNVNSPEDI